MQVVEDDPKYWEVMSSALAVGWLDIVVSGLIVRCSFIAYNDESMMDILFWNFYDLMQFCISFCR